MKFKHHLDFLSIITFSFTVTVIQSDDINFTSSNEEIVEKHNNQFDFMLFAQIWPISGCLEWEERSEDNTCYLPGKFFSISRKKNSFSFPRDSREYSYLKKFVDTKIF